MCRSAPRFTSISLSAIALASALLAVAGSLPAAADDSVRARAVELEASLVKTPALYVVLDAAERKLEVRSRGLILDSVPLQVVTLLHYRPLFGSGDEPAPEVPAIWNVIEGPGDTYRDVIAPEALKPYVSEDEREEEAVSTAKKEPPVPPSQYFVKLANGWQLGIFDRVPRTGFFPRLAQAVGAGWKRLRGQNQTTPPVVALAMTADDARRIHHVFRTDLALLVLPAAH
jgi:hypothetical protein